MPRIAKQSEQAVRVGYNIQFQPVFAGGQFFSRDFRAVGRKIVEMSVRNAWFAMALRLGQVIRPDLREIYCVSFFSDCAGVGEVERAWRK